MSSLFGILLVQRDCFTPKSHVHKEMCLFSFKFGGGLRSKTFGMNWPVIQFMSVNICAALSDVSVAEWEQIPAGRSQKKIM